MRPNNVSVFRHASFSLLNSLNPLAEQKVCRTEDKKEPIFCCWTAKSKSLWLCSNTCTGNGRVVSFLKHLRVLKYIKIQSWFVFGFGAGDQIQGLAKYAITTEVHLQPPTIIFHHLMIKGHSSLNVVWLVGWDRSQVAQGSHELPILLTHLPRTRITHVYPHTREQRCLREWSRWCHHIDSLHEAALENPTPSVSNTVRPSGWPCWTAALL